MMQQAKLIFGIAAIVVFLGPSPAVLADCRKLEPPGRLVTSISPLKQTEAPQRHLPFPEGPLDMVRVSLDRTECYGGCPSYSVELRGDGSAVYTGKAFVLVAGLHTFDVPKESVQCLLAHFREADFWSLRNEYVAGITDNPEYRVTLTIGHQTKTLVDYVGAAVGMPRVVTAIEDEIDRVGANRWVHGTSETLPSLRTEHFDFHSPTAATLLANAAAAAPDDLVMGLIEAGAPVTGQASEPGREIDWTAVERASRAGRPAIVQTLIDKGAFLQGPPNAKELSLINGAASGNSLVVAEILKYRPRVNAQDREGDTALISMWQSQHFGPQPSKADIVAVARLLLEAGADPNIANKDGSTALFSANNAAVVALLLKAGARLETRNKDGCTPLLYAESDDAASALIEAGADIGATSRSGETIERMATRMKFTKTIRMLRDKAAGK